MEIVITNSPQECGQLAAGAIIALVERKRDAVIGLATGTSPLPVYDSLADAHARGDVRFDRVRFVQLDEYLGLPTDHERSYRTELHRSLLSRIGLGPSHLIGPEATSEDLLAMCAEYELALERLGGVDLQLLGIGSNGHVGFNEPTSSLGSRTRIKTLDARTVRDNTRFFEGEERVPTHVVTQGVGTILAARHIVLVAFGRSKSAPIAAAVEGPVTAFVPASALQLHPHVTVIVDEEAASGLQLADYYRSTFASKPAWQGL